MQNFDRQGFGSFVVLICVTYSAVAISVIPEDREHQEMHIQVQNLDIELKFAKTH